jgi:hypothetical protein
MLQPKCYQTGCCNKVKNSLFKYCSYKPAAALLSGILCGLITQAQEKITVAKSGRADFNSIQAAINSLPDSSASPRTISIRAGVYNEKLYIEKSNIILEGEDREKTIITEAIARDEWRCGHTDDWGVATMNVGASDLTLNGPAAIWHDGSRHEDSKTVLLNCRFKGYDGFLLGRYHRDAQFYLVNCSFAANMKDSAIYLVATTNNIRWGKRIYYYNCHRDGGKDYSWYSNNLPAGITASAITPDWVFKGRWNPALN